MDSANQKGRALEGAVRLIEEFILRSFPGYQEKTFRIDARKRFLDDGGVLHEIDLWVDVELGSGYSSRFIFECRNWNDPIGKDHIVAFSEKIRATQAQRGFFVAKDFSRYARAQAQKDPRVTLLTFEEFPPATVDEVTSQQVIAIENQVSSIEFIEAAEASQSRSLDPSATSLVSGDLRVPLHDYGETWGFEVARRRGAELGVGSKPNGTVLHLDAEDVRKFSPGDLVIDGKSYSEARLRLSVDLRVIFPRVVTTFDVRTRGRVTVLEKVKIGDAEFEMSVVERAE